MSVVKKIAAGGSLLTCWAMGLTQHKNAVDTIREIANLHLLGGYIGKKGDIVVDNYLKPSQVLGVSDGSGKFEKKISKKTKLKIKLIKKKLDLNN